MCHLNKDIKMVDIAFLSAKMMHYIYKRKENTKGSYYSDSAGLVLPQRFSFDTFDITKVRKKGRALIEKSAGQLIGKFKIVEESPLKQYKPFDCRTQIFASSDYPLLIGYGTLGITGRDGRVTCDNGDIVVLYTSDKLDTLNIFYFQNLNKPEYKDGVLAFVNDYVRRNNI